MDYDVSAVALATPPSLASLTTYRPAMLVKNNGRFPATASGTLSAYKAGRPVYSSTITSPSIQPGESGLATAADDWTPDEQGDYVWFGYLTTYRDQNQGNGFLPPRLIHVGPEPPTPPSPVPNHHEQHEHGGGDVVDVEDLPGLLRDAQTPTDHASSHQAGGGDQLNVAGLAGLLGEAQIPTDHGNEHHSPDFASMAELTNHENATTVHTAATNLANRDISGPDSGLLPTAQLIHGTNLPPNDNEALLRTRFWGYPKHASIGNNAGPVLISPGDGYKTLISLPIPSQWSSDDMQIILECYCAINAHAAVDPTATFRLRLGSTILLPLELITNLVALIPARIRATIAGYQSGTLFAALELVGETDPATIRFSMTTTPAQRQPGDTISLEAEISTGPIIGDSLQDYFGFARALHPIP